MHSKKPKLWFTEKNCIFIYWLLKRKQKQKYIAVITSITKDHKIRIQSNSDRGRIKYCKVHFFTKCQKRFSDCTSFTEVPIKRSTLKLCWFRLTLIMHLRIQFDRYQKKSIKVLLAYPPKWQIINQIQANNPKIINQLNRMTRKVGKFFSKSNRLTQKVGQNFS